MRLRAEQLDAQLQKSLASAYLVHGDEPLLALEAADAIRAAARKKGFAEREVMFAEKGFDWGALVYAGASQSLFGDRKMVELRLASGRVAAAGAQAIAACLARPNPDMLLMMSMPRPEGANWWKAAWFTAFESGGVIVEAQPLSRAALPQWIAGRLARQKQRASAEALAFLAEHVEGNLLAAQQEIAKLSLLAPEGAIGLDEVRAAVSNVARYSFEALAEALHGGDFPQFARALAGLRGEGESIAGIAWRLGEELAALARVKAGLAQGRRQEQLFMENKLFRAAQPRCEKALRRHSAARLREAVVRMSRIERASKGVGRGEPWDALLRLGLEFAHGSGH
ncbi:MAG: DNA polymerase III subunit delta [Proteobacteria bacterium]|nr:DNA polymerase III subunit delta [Pseudomonadota bacterium]MDA0983086.1 DNA polymerase III subunit delta [Pseudomonadota bacterium]